ncbi:MAG: hypothetical protein RIQ33_2534, partial [Bacteroidota bacterium]
MKYCLILFSISCTFYLSCSNQNNSGFETKLESTINQKLIYCDYLMNEKIDFDSSAKIATQIIENEELPINSKVKARAYFVLEKVALFEGKLSVAMKRVVGAEVIFQAINDSVNLNQCNYQKGLIYYMDKNYSLAKNVFTSTTKYFRYTNNDSLLNENIYLSALCDIELNQLNDAEVKLKAALKYFSNAKRADGKLECLSGIAKINYLKKSYLSSISIYDSLYKLSKSNDNSQGIAISLIGLGKNNYANDNLTIANLQLSDAYKLSTKLHYHEGLLESAYYLWQLNKKKNNFIASDTFHEIYYSIRDSIYNQQTSRNISDIQSQTYIVTKEKQISKLNIQQKTYRYLMLLLALIITLGSFTLYIVYRSSKLKQKLNDRLMQSNVELQFSQE